MSAAIDDPTRIRNIIRHELVFLSRPSSQRADPWLLCVVVMPVTLIIETEPLPFVIWFALALLDALWTVTFRYRARSSDRAALAYRTTPKFASVKSVPRVTSGPRDYLAPRTSAPPATEAD